MSARLGLRRADRCSPSCSARSFPTVSGAEFQLSFKQISDLPTRVQLGPRACTRGRIWPRICTRCNGTDARQFHDGTHVSQRKAGVLASPGGRGTGGRPGGGTPSPGRGQGGPIAQFSSLRGLTYDRLDTCAASRSICRCNPRSCSNVSTARSKSEPSVYVTW